MRRITVLLGGIWGPDGYADSAGMWAFGRSLGAAIYTWNDWLRAAHDFGDHEVVIGYSGGGSRATWLAEETPHTIDLMVLYDPSPRWQMKRLSKRVRQTLCYYNTHPEMGPLGGGKATGDGHIDIIPISEQHLKVDWDEKLHNMTRAAITALL